MRLLHLSTLVALLLSSGCAPIHVGLKDSFMKHGLPKAAFDMDCPKQQLEVTEIGARSMGVRGCGKKQRYQYVDNVGWILESGHQNCSP